jgi:hypothetical protein
VTVGVAVVDIIIFIAVDVSLVDIVEVVNAAEAAGSVSE